MYPTTKRTCPVCEVTLRGRSDKKFCSDLCRSTFHNRKMTEDQEMASVVQWVNGILRKNRSILGLFAGPEPIRVQQEALIRLGFNFEVFTGVKKAGAHEQQYYCYDHWFKPANKNEILIGMDQSALRYNTV